MADDITSENQSPAKPGWKTSEAWITLIVLILAGLISTGLVGEMSQTGKIITLALGVAKALGYTWSRTAIKNAAMLVLFVALAHGSMACGGSAKTAAVRDAMAFTDASSQAFAAYDAAKQMSIVDRAQSKEEGRQALSVWRESRLIVEYTLASMYRTIAIAATDDDVTIADLVRATEILRDTLRQIGVKVP